MKTIAFIGLGSMGRPMAVNLAKAGYAVNGYDTNSQSVERVALSGVQGCVSIPQACKDADLLLLMVVNAKQAQQVLVDERALEHIPAHCVVCLMSTCAPDQVREIDGLVRATQRQFVDCPVSGGVVGAESASLTLMAACDKDLFEIMRDVFNSLGSRVYHVGNSPGQGAMCKTINQLLCGLHIAVAAEAFSLARKANLDTNLLLEIMSGSSASSWMLTDRGPRMLEEVPNVTSAVDIFVKDLEIVSQAGRDAKAALPLTAVALQLFIAASGRGFGALDDSQVIRSFDALNGV